MSGTSLDGVDAAVLVTDGERIAGFGPTAYRPYAASERRVLRAALGRWPGEPGVAEAARVVEAAHVELLRGLPGEVVGFHGQTAAHEPPRSVAGGRGTHQLGCGDRLARALGRPVAWDFRSADVAAGGEGAPLAPAYHLACARWAGLTGPVAFLNLGGVSNLTWLDPAAEGPGAMLAFDAGPAGAPIDDLVARRTGAAFDEGGRLAAAGRPDEAVVEALLGRDLLRRAPPRSYDRGDFADLEGAVADLDDADAAATLTEAVAACVAAALAWCPARPSRLLATGGGRRNPAVMDALRRRTGLPVEPVDAIGLDGDMLEAQAFAFLAVRVLRGLPLSHPSTTGVPRPTPGGRVGRPDAWVGAPRRRVGEAAREARP